MTQVHILSFGVLLETVYQHVDKSLSYNKRLVSTKHGTVWTPSLTGKRPVMFYIHGGGYSFGSSYELVSHDGAQMARHHDVVQVSVNHRLNALGFLDVSEVGGSAYGESVNVGMTDLVAALKWVQGNISNFGGDPDKVMIYGQSGGGSKVTTLLGMPSATGLIHRVSVQPGGGGNIPTGEQQREYARDIVKELGIGAHDIEALQKMEWSKLMKAAGAVSARMYPPGTGAPGPFGPPRAGWSPSVDGNVITMRSFADAAPEISKNVPMLMGSVSEEGNHMRSRPTEEEWHATLVKFYEEQKATALVAGLKKAHPQKSIRTLSYMCGGPGLNSLSMRNNVVKMAKLKHDLKAAPAYAYYFTWQSPMLEDAGAWHTAEHAFCFDNTKRCEQGTGNTPEAQALAKKMATAWANFARTGNPSQPGLTWTPTDPDSCKTMVFDNECRMVDDPEGEVHRVASRRRIAAQAVMVLVPRTSQTACLRRMPLGDQYRCLCFSPMPASPRITCPLDCGPTSVITPRCFSRAWTLSPKGKMRLPIPKLGA